MHKQTFKLTILALLAGLFILTGFTFADKDVPESYTKSAISADSFSKRLRKLKKKIKTVSASIQKAEGLAKQKGQIDLQVAKYFAEYIEWELDHPEIMTEALASNDFFDTQKKLSPEERVQRYNNNIDRELTGSMVILDQALKRIENPSDLKEIEPIQWKDMVYRDGNFQVDGKVVFPGGFNMLGRNLINKEEYPNWTEQDEAKTRGFLPEMRDMGVGVVGTGIPVTGLITEQGTINHTIIEQKMDEVREFADIGIKVDLMLSWGGNEAVLEKLWPGITKHYSNGVAIDIDHPGSRELVKKVMAEVIPITSAHKAVISYDLANEPFFNMDGWTDHSMNAYYKWLKKRHGSIEGLNRAWKTDYETFQKIPYPKDKPREDCSVGEWYDRITFHNYRTASFFDYVAQEIRRYDPDAVIHVKGQDNNSLGPKPWAVTDGIDREMMTPTIDLHGLDTRPLPVTEPRMAVIIDDDADDAILNYDASIYGFHWLGQSFLYDYLSSLKPDKPIVDFEYHAFSINPIRVPDIGHGHASSTFWLAHMQGLVGNMVWYWHRRYGPNPFPAEYFKWWIYASISTQPIVAAEYFQTMLDLNMYADEITALDRQPAKRIGLFVSKPSYVQNQHHIAALHRAYEGTCFHDIPVGFVTEDMLMKHGIPEDMEMIVIPDAQYVSAPALAMLKQVKQRGLQLVRFGRYNITYDEYGFPYKEDKVAFLKSIPLLDYADAQDLSIEFGKLIKPIAEEVPVTVKNSNGENAFGVMRRFTILDGRSIMLLVNVSNKAMDLKLINREGQTVNGYDLLNQEDVQGSALHLPVKGVRLIEIKNNTLENSY